MTKLRNAGGLARFLVAIFGRTGAVARDVVLADAGYGVDGAIRARLTALGLTYAVGAQPTLAIWPPETRRDIRQVISTPRSFQSGPSIRNLLAPNTATDALSGDSAVALRRSAAVRSKYNRATSVHGNWFGHKD